MIVCAAVNDITSNEINYSNQSITLLGLGAMGRAVLKCYAKHKYTVHAWNRGEENLQKIRKLGLNNAVVVHKSLETAVEASNTILLVINSEPKPPNCS